MPVETNTLNELLFRLLDNDISDGDFARLKSRLDSDEEAKRYYCRFMQDYSALSLRTTTALHDQGPATAEEELLSDHFWRLMSDEETNAPAVELFVSDAPPAEREPVRRVQRTPMARTVNKTSLLVAMVSLAALCVMVAYVYLAPPAPYAVATIVDCIDAEWSSDLPLKSGTSVSTHARPIHLTQGIVKLVTDQQVEVVLEAPTEFRFISYSEIALGYGKLFAHVSDQGGGFSVTTPNSKIVDLGTEFGVISQIDGNTEVYMYKGKANLFAGQTNETKISELLVAGTAKKIDRTDSAVEAIALEKNLVVRTIDSKTNFVWRGESVSLADLVGGGNGFGTGEIDKGIDIASGRLIEQLARMDVYPGPTRYVPVSTNPYVDGVFVPGVDGGAVQIASDGLTTGEFPATSGQVWGYLFNGAWHEGTAVPRHRLQLSDMPLDGRKNPAITMHSNLGITFDLSAIRAEMPRLRIASFTATPGISQTVDRWLKGRDFSDVADMTGVEKLIAARHSTVEVWVFLDGRKVLRQTVSSGSTAPAIAIPIDDRVRFLTLAVTEADDTFMFDWAVLARPELIVESTDSLSP